MQNFKFLEIAKEWFILNLTTIIWITVTILITFFLYKFLMNISWSKVRNNPVWANLRIFFNKFWKNAQFFFAWLGGCERKLLEQTPPTIRNKRATQGALIFFTVIFGSMMITGAVGMTIISNVFALFAFFALWFLLISSVERLIMIKFDMEKYTNWMKAIVATIRILIIVGLAFIYGEIVGTLLFKTEIEYVLEQERQDEVDGLYAFRDSSNLVLNDQVFVFKTSILEAENEYQEIVETRRQEIADAEAVYLERQQLLLDEIDGIVRAGSTGLAGDGASAQAKRKALQRDSVRIAEKKADFETFLVSNIYLSKLEFSRLQNDKEIADLELLIAENNTICDKGVSKIESRPVGLNDRFHGLHELRSQNYMVWAVFLFFLVVESLPLIFKLQSKPDAYDNLVDLQLADKRSKQYAKVKKNLEAKLEHETAISGINRKLLENTQERLTLEQESIDSEISHVIEKVRKKNEFDTQLGENISSRERNKILNRVFKN